MWMRSPAGVYIREKRGNGWLAAPSESIPVLWRGETHAYRFPSMESAAEFAKKHELDPETITYIFEEKS